MDKVQSAGSLPNRIVATVLAIVLAFLGVPALPAQAVAVESQLVAADASGLEAQQLGEPSEPTALSVQADDYDITWYEGQASPFTISSIPQLKGLAYLVNEGVHDFEGEVVQLPDSVTAIFAFTASNAIKPIGTTEHPFEGTFDGRGRTIANLALSASGRLEYVGLFGYAGENATIKNLTLQGGKITVTNKEAGKTIGNIGAIAGYLGGDIQNCYSSVEVSVANDGTVPEKEGKTAEELCTIIYVGGLVGYLGGDMVDCTHADATLSIASASNVSDNVPYIAGFIGGLAGMQGDIQDALNVPETTGCVNSGPLSFNVSGKGGIDRFNQQMYSKSTMVGGIVGYTMGNVADCSNTADVQTGLMSGGQLQVGWGATTTGGIVGSFRGPTLVESTAATGVVGTNSSDPGYDVWLVSNGTQEAPEISISRCVNTAHVVGLSSVGGICGSGGAFTRIEACANSGKVDGTRWNKPCPAGIVGIMNGDIAYCSNTGRIETTDGGGYYASGITGLFTTYNSATTETHLLLDASEMYGCYVSGNIVSAKAGYRSAVLAGENDGYIHDNCFLANLTNDKVVDEEIFGDSELHSRLVSPDEDRGTLIRNYELSPADLRGSRGISLLNYPTATSGSWDVYYMPNPDATGFPLQNWRLSGQSASQTNLNDIVKAGSAKLVSNPTYSAAVEPLPQVTLETSNGVTLYQNADYRVVPQAGAKAVSGGTPYMATIVGMNGYTGTLAQTVGYGIDKCNIGACKVLAGSQVFNWQPQDPAWVRVVDDAGNTVSPDDYTWEKVDFDPTNVKRDSNGKYHDYTNVHNGSYRYDIKVTAKDSSACYVGDTVQAAFHIEWALLIYESADSDSTKHGAVYDKVLWQDQEWDYADAIKTKGFVKIKYTGSAIKPTVGKATYLGVTLRDGTGKPYYNNPLEYDYRYIYGNSNATEAEAVGADCVNVTGSGEQDFDCMTVRYIPGSNFTNYSNVYFEITPASIVDDVAISGIEASYPYTGKPITVSPTLTYNGMSLVEGTDYDVSYANNVWQKTATVTITGKGNYDGSVQKDFAIEGAPPIPMSQVAVSGLEDAYSYTGQPISVVPTLTYDGYVLVEGVDYEFKCSDNVQAGTAKMTVTGKGSFSGTVEKPYTINPASIAQVSVTGIESAYPYTGDPITVSPALTYNGMTLAEGTDYELSYQGNVRGKTATVTITGQGNYSGSIQKTFEIEGVPPVPLGQATIAGIDASYPFTGQPVIVSATLTYDGYTLQEGIDYECAYSDNVQAGTAKVAFTGRDSFSGTVERSFAIASAPISQVSIAGIEASYPYTGRPIIASPVLTYNGQTLVEGTDYELGYSDNINVGSAKLIITGKGSFDGTVDEVFSIVKASQTVKAANKTVKRKAKKLQSKKLTIDAAKVAGVTAKTALTYTGKADKSKAKFSVSKKGVITIKKGTKKGAYKVTVTAKAAANQNYKAAQTTFVITVKVV